MHFSEATIYSTDPTADPSSEWPAELGVRQAIIFPSDEFVSHVVDHHRHPDKYQLEIQNLSEQDLFLFTSLFMEHPVSQTEGYVVTEPGVAIHGDIVEANPGKYASRSLMEKIESIGPDELIQFNLTALAKYAYKNLASRNNLT